MEPAQLFLRQKALRVIGVRGKEELTSLCWRQADYVHRHTMCVLVTNGLLFHGQSMLWAAA